MYNMKLLPLGAQIQTKDVCKETEAELCLRVFVEKQDEVFVLFAEFLIAEEAPDTNASLPRLNFMSLPDRLFSANQTSNKNPADF